MEEQCRVFVITRPPSTGEDKKKYRCVAVLEHLPLEGLGPLLLARSFLKLLQNPLHAMVVQAELVSRDTHDSQKSCPFVGTLLITAAQIHLDQVHMNYTDDYGGTLELTYEWDTSWSYNTGWSTVFDLTDPTRPRYCFVFVPRNGRYTHIESNVALSTEQYLIASRSVPSRESNDSQALDAKKDLDYFAQYEIVEQSSLAEALIDHQWHESRPAAKIIGEQHSSGMETMSGPRSLESMALEIALPQALVSDDASGLLTVGWTVDLARQCIVLLRKETSFKSTGVELLIKSLETLCPNDGIDQTTLNLASYALTRKQLLRIVQQFPGIETLNLSNNAMVDVSVVKSACSAARRLATFILVGCKTITTNDITNLTYSDSDAFIPLIYHTGLLLSTRVPQPSTENGLVILLEEQASDYTGGSPPDCTGCRLPSWWSRSGAARAMCDAMASLRAMDAPTQAKAAECLLSWQTYFSMQGRDEDASMDEQTIAPFPVHIDVPIQRPIHHWTLAIRVHSFFEDLPIEYAWVRTDGAGGRGIGSVQLFNTSTFLEQTGHRGEMPSQAILGRLRELEEECTFMELMTEEAAAEFMETHSR